MSNQQQVIQTDVLLIGAGIMSATFGTMLKELEPSLNIQVIEKLAKAGEESSGELNNAGTGHAALCELNYTSEKRGKVNISKAINVNEQFQLSLQFWSHLVRKGLIQDPKDFIMPLPHISMVQGEDNVAFLKRRFEAMKENPLFSNMTFSDDPSVLKEWFPLIMKNRNQNDKIAATKVDTGTDVNFGALTRMLMRHLKNQEVGVHYKQMVKNLRRLDDGSWEVKVTDLKSNETIYYHTKFVFLGAGGASLQLLQKSGIPEGKGVGGFPISGLFLACKNPEIIEKHHAKVYGKAAVGAPPMSVPHLDTRYVDGKKTLLFGPFAGFSPKFLKNGSYMDLVASVKTHNIANLLSAGVKEMKLTKYLIQQLMLSKKARIEELRQFVPTAKMEDWELLVAGQRVQVIKETEENGKGTLQFGTEIITSADGSVAALLGASPGASTAVHVMLQIIDGCFPEHKEAWMPKLKEMVPSYGQKLEENTELLELIRAYTQKTLQLNKEQ